MTKKIGGWILGLAVAAEVAGAAAGLVLGSGPLAGSLASLDHWVTSAGALGPAVYAAGYAIAVVMFVPGTALTLGAGFLFGPGIGFLAASAGSTSGAAAAFLVARHVARARVEAWVLAHPRLAAADRILEREGWKFVALSRLSPLFPFNALNYAYGVTRIPFMPYVLASWLPMAPATLLGVTVGSLARHGLGVAGLPGQAQLDLVLELGGAAAAFIAVLWAGRLARRALDLEGREDPGAAGAAAPPVRGRAGR